MEYNTEEYTEEYNAYGYQTASHDDYHSGDPRLDMEYGRQYESHKLPEVVRNFLIYLSKAIDEGNVYELQNLYENSYVKLTERFFKATPWPLSQDVEVAVTNDELFIILYKELYYRHLYARVTDGPNIQERFDSYFNYCNLFNLILSPDQSVRLELELPNQWLWEIIDEFIYQFQNFSHYQSMLSKKTADEIEQLQLNLKVWNVHSVLNVLHSLVDKSNINRQLEVYTNGDTIGFSGLLIIEDELMWMKKALKKFKSAEDLGGDPDSVAGEFGRHPLYKMLGYFSLVGLLRLHCLLGDYYQAIKVLENIELNKKSLYSRVPACQITTYYYVGFSYMMMRRYSDAIRSFSNILLYIQRIHRSLLQQRTYQSNQINKQTDRMYTLLAICLVLHPQRIDESVLSQLKEKHGDKLLRMQRCELDEFESSFTFACPKFLSPVPPTFPKKFNPATMTLPDNHKEPFLAQLAVFMDEIRQQLQLPIIRSYLKLYTTMPITKLAAFLDKDEETFVSSLLCFKHKMKNLVWTKGTSGLEGEFQSGSEVDFFIDKDMIHIADTKVARRYGDFFIRQIHKFDELHRMITALQI